MNQQQRFHIRRGVGVEDGDQFREQRRTVDRIQKDCEAIRLECQRQRKMIEEQREFLNSISQHHLSAMPAERAGEAGGVEAGGIAHAGQ